jgi:hypothetical protein
VQDHPTGREAGVVLRYGPGCLLAAIPFALLLVLLLTIRWLDPLHGLVALAGIVLLALLIVALRVADNPEEDEPAPERQVSG